MLAHVKNGLIKHGDALDVKNDQVNTRFGQVRYEAQRVNRAQVNLKGQPGQRTQRGDGPGWEAQVRHEMAVEHIQVEEIQAGRFEASHFFGQPPVVAVKQGCAEPDLA